MSPRKRLTSIFKENSDNLHSPCKGREHLADSRASAIEYV